MSLGILPAVTFYKHTDFTLFGSAVPLTIEFSDTLNGVGSGRCTFNAADIRNISWDQTVGTTVEQATVWNRPTIVNVQNQYGTVFPFVAEDVEFDRADDVWQGTVTISGRGIGSVLDYATVYQVQPGASKLYPASTRASVLTSLISDAQLRGAIPWIGQTFDATTDSDGNPWIDADNIRVRDGGTLLQLLTNYGEATWDWHVGTNGNIGAWLHKGSDYSASLEINPAVHGIGESGGTEKWDLRPLYTRAYGEATPPAGGALAVGGYSSDPDRVTRYGMRESYQSLGNIADLAQLAGIADDSSQISISRTITVNPQIPGATPYEDFQLGDTITLAVSSAKDYPATTYKSKARVMGWAWRRDAEGAQTVELVLDTILQHRRRVWEREQDLAQGDIPTPILEGIQQSTRGDDADPSLLITPSDPGQITFLDPAATTSALAAYLGHVPPDPAVSGAGATLYVTRLQGSELGASGTPYIELDPNNGEIRFNPPVGGFLPSWEYVALGSADNAIYNSPDSVGTTAGDPGTRIEFYGLGGTAYIQLQKDANAARTVNYVGTDGTWGDFGAVSAGPGTYGGGDVASMFASSTRADFSATSGSHFAKIGAQSATGAYLQVGPIYGGLFYGTGSGGQFGVFGAIASQQSTPTTLAQVISILQAFGFCV